MATRKPTSTTLKKGDVLPPRGKGKKSLMLDAIRDVCGNEQDFLKQVVAIGLTCVAAKQTTNIVAILLIIMSYPNT